MKSARKSASELAPVEPPREEQKYLTPNAELNRMQIRKPSRREWSKAKANLEAFYVDGVLSHSDARLIGMMMGLVTDA